MTDGGGSKKLASHDVREPHQSPPAPCIWKTVPVQVVARNMAHMAHMARNMSECDRVTIMYDHDKWTQWQNVVVLLHYGKFT